MQQISKHLIKICSENRKIIMGKVHKKNKGEEKIMYGDL